MKYDVAVSGGECVREAELVREDLGALASCLSAEQEYYGQC